MSLIERHSVERQIIDGAERDVLVVWALSNCGAHCMPDLLKEAEALCDQSFYRIEFHLPAAWGAPP